MKSYGVTIQMKATEQYSPVVLFIMLYKVVQTFQSVDEIPKYDQSNESYWVVLYCGTIYYNAQGGSNSNKSYLKVIMFDFQKSLIGKCGLAAFLIL